MELQDIAEQTGLRLRMLRYVIDHSLISGLPVNTNDEALGRPRQFNIEDALVIACAATLLDGGVKREAVVQCVTSLRRLAWEGNPIPEVPPKNILHRLKNTDRSVLSSIFKDGGSAFVMLGDGINIQVRMNAENTGWRQPETLARLGDEYQPQVTILLDLARLRNQLKNTK